MKQLGKRDNKGNKIPKDLEHRGEKFSLEQQKVASSTKGRKVLRTGVRYKYGGFVWGGGRRGIGDSKFTLFIFSVE